MLDRALEDLALAGPAGRAAALVRQRDPRRERRVEQRLVGAALEGHTGAVDLDDGLADRAAHQKIGMIFSGSKTTSRPSMPTSGSAGNSMP